MDSSAASGTTSVGSTVAIVWNERRNLHQIFRVSSNISEWGISLRALAKNLEKLKNFNIDFHYSL